MRILFHFVKRESFPSKGCRLFAKTLPAPWGLMSCKATLVGNKRWGGCLGMVPLSDKQNFCYSWCCQTLKNNLESNWRINSRDQRRIKETEKSPACCVNLQISFGVSALQSPKYSPSAQAQSLLGEPGRKALRYKPIFFFKSFILKTHLKIGHSH